MKIITNADKIDFSQMPKSDVDRLCQTVRDYMLKLRKLPNYQRDFQAWLVEYRKKQAVKENADNLSDNSQVND